MIKYHKKNEGFAALFVVIILTGIIITLILTSSASVVWSVRGSLDSRNGERAKALTAACAEMALEALREYNVYEGTNNLTIDGNSCVYTVSNTGGDTRSIVVSGVVGDITRKINITTSGFNPMIISSWQETP